MDSKNSRLKRINEQLRQELSLLIRKDVNDSRALMISVTQVDTVRDFSQAKVYITYLGPDEERQEMISLLHEYGPEFRRQLGKILRIRTIPRFHFIYDDLLEKSNAITSLITEAIRTDEMKAKESRRDDSED
ncbi:30S ribosome-binding factor RbfA [Ignatzschineria cameli]|uniref:Ribosome-binding factor A n=1 Tax=Ignatzschineria cameli TaxID=2182793 RepID=A0A2U2APY0_9GAMM|nr:30S ribosome-binding factor RbfA [Ignatzschineria cameli]PWD83391.1 30S ribosome-binding factor RbfA [Ignatzschineria cameli]PWD85509.1 30S ribosome-binding factor RbfA [Ignatzschineria cameli]PWD89177.1 30S ribosome-binding factor RbfA [Ignatzschineria cameli]PWD90649.1 30S ribosome-binding factor RbfA [Ignatzschineria cameli]PWD91353.1 30S ribosome-binding factor RbfA [Ignatzschineria cameli]